jgi:hypothetical protein
MKTGMARLVVGTLSLGLLAGAAFAGPPTAAQKAEFYKVCMGIASNDTLCTCKRDATTKLIDADFMAVVIASMKGRAAPAEVTAAYDTYIAKSNAVCIPGY